MPTAPDKLVILQGHRLVLMSIWPVLAGLPAIVDLSRHWLGISAPWVIGAYLLLFCGSEWTRFSKRDSRRYVVFDESGVWVSTRRRGPIPRSFVESCACKHERKRRILRIFLRKDALRSLRVSRPKNETPAEVATRVEVATSVGLTKTHLDIDFGLAEKPDSALDAAFPACAHWIAATRDPSPTSPPIREFGDDRTGRPTKTRILVWSLILVAAIVGFLVARHRTVIEEPPSVLDERPGQSVLFLGNSRIAVHNLPKVVRDIADSAHSPIRYDVQMRAWGGATLEDHWQDDGDQKLLHNSWSVVILQPQSGAFGSAASLRNFDEYGEKLIRAIEDDGAKVALVSNWTLGPNHFNGDEERLDGDPKSYGDLIDRRTRALAQSTGAGDVELEPAFAVADASMPELALTSDGNHPTPAGTYLAALMIYRYLSHDDLANVSWRPFDMNAETAAQLKQIAMRYAP